MTEQYFANHSLERKIVEVFSEQPNQPLRKEPEK